MSDLSTIRYRTESVLQDDYWDFIKQEHYTSFEKSIMLLVDNLGSFWDHFESDNYFNYID